MSSLAQNGTGPFPLKPSDDYLIHIAIDAKAVRLAGNRMAKALPSVIVFPAKSVYHVANDSGGFRLFVKERYQ